MTKSSIILMFLIISSCTKDNNVEIFNTTTQLKFESKYSISKVEFKKREKHFDCLKKNFQYKNRNDTIFLVVETDKNELSKVAWTYPLKKNPSELNCEKKITLKSNEISFIFCYQDILSFLKKYDDMSDIRYSYMFNVKEYLLKTEQNKVTNSSIFNDILISDFIRNIPFKIFNEKEKTFIPYIHINEFKISAWHGYDHYLINKSEDTIASFSFIDTHTSVDLWQKW